MTSDFYGDNVIITLAEGSVTAFWVTEAMWEGLVNHRESDSLTGKGQSRWEEEARWKTNGW